MLSSLICSADGAGVGDGEGVGGVGCWVFEPSRGRRSNLYFSDTVLHLRVRNIRMHPSCTSGAPVAYSSTGDVSDTYWEGILGGRPWIRMYVARHQKEPELCAV